MLVRHSKWLKLPNYVGKIKAMNRLLYRLVLQPKVSRDSRIGRCTLRSYFEIGLSENAMITKLSL